MRKAPRTPSSDELAFVQKCDAAAAALGVNRAQLSGWLYGEGFDADHGAPALGSVQSDHLDKIITGEHLTTERSRFLMLGELERLLEERSFKLVTTYSVQPILWPRTAHRQPQADHGSASTLTVVR